MIPSTNNWKYLLVNLAAVVLKTILYTDNHINSTSFVFPRGNYQETNKIDRSMDFRSSYPSSEWKQKLQQAPQNLAFFPTHLQDYYQDSYRNSNELVFTFGRNLVDVIGTSNLNWNVLGTLYFDVSISAFDEIFKQLNLNEQDAVYVIDNTGHILFSNHLDEVGKAYQGEHTEDYINVSKDIPRAGWHVVGEIYKEEMFSKINQVKNTIAIVIGLCILSLVIVAIWFSKNFSNPIRSIMLQMAKVESGNFDNRVEIRSRDEIGLLANGFNRMTQRLQSYINEVYVAQIKQKQAELHALKSQIRPHYLYNTLEVIRMSAVANDDEEVGDMIMSLSHQLKYVLDYGEEIVSVFDELSNIEQYFRLMELRYGKSRMSMDIRVNEKLMGCAMPKLSLQPLVENAVYHGIMTKAGKGTIRISVAQEVSYLVIIVDDDGIGISANELEQLRDKLSGKATTIIGEAGGIGLKNVHDRIIALYGHEYGIEINSRPQIGTSVRMVIPKEKKVNLND